MTYENYAFIYLMGFAITARAAYKNLMGKPHKEAPLAIFLAAILIGLGWPYILPLRIVQKILP